MPARCLIDSDSFDIYPSPHDDLDALSDMIEHVVELVRDEEILTLPENFSIVVTCDPKLVNWSTPGQHLAEKQIVYMCGVYNLDEIIRFLAHELIHVEQVELGWLAYNHQSEALEWFGKPMQWHEDITDEQYRNLPWERDAFGREHAVYQQIRKHLDAAIAENIWNEDLWLADTDATSVAKPANRLLN